MEIITKLIKYVFLKNIQISNHTLLRNFNALQKVLPTSNLGGILGFLKDQYLGQPSL